MTFCSEKFELAKTAAQEQVDASRSTLDDLDELADIMSDMLQKQQEVEVRFSFVSGSCMVSIKFSVWSVGQADCDDLLEGLQQRLLVVEDLHHRFVQYQSSFHKLLIEIARRRQYREAAEKIVEGMMSQLDALFSGKSRSSALFPDHLISLTHPSTHLPNINDVAQRKARYAKTSMPSTAPISRQTFVSVSRTRRRGGRSSLCLAIRGRCYPRLMRIC